MTDRLNRWDYDCMRILFECDCFNYFSSLTIDEIRSRLEVKRNTLYKRLQRLCNMKYMELGCKSERQDTYFLTASGRNLIETYLVVEEKSRNNHI